MHFFSKKKTKTHTHTLWPSVFSVFLPINFIKMFLILDWPCLWLLFLLHTAYIILLMILLPSTVSVIISSWPACKSAALCRNLVLPSRPHPDIWGRASYLNILLPLFCLHQTCCCCVAKEMHFLHNHFPRFSSLIIWTVSLLNFLLLHLGSRRKGRRQKREIYAPSPAVLSCSYFNIWFYSLSWII